MLHAYLRLHYVPAEQFESINTSRCSMVNILVQKCQNASFVITSFQKSIDAIPVLLESNRTINAHFWPFVLPSYLQHTSQSIPHSLNKEYPLLKQNKLVIYIYITLVEFQKQFFFNPFINHCLVEFFVYRKMVSSNSLFFVMRFS